MAAEYALRAGEVHIWLLALSAPVDGAARARYRSLLDAQELERLGRFAFEHLRDEFLVSHALTRLILSRYESAPAEGLTLARNAYGRPELSPSRIGLRFNLSHAAGRAALAVTLADDIGVDLERDDRPLDITQIAGHYFAPAEQAWLERQPLAQRQRAFFELWTLKEAYIKARGLGLTLELDQFAIGLADRSRPTIEFADHLDDPARWQLALFEPFVGYVLALAVRRGAAARGEIALIDAAARLSGMLNDM